MAEKEIFRMSIGDATIEHYLLLGGNIARNRWEANRHINMDYELFLILNGICSVEVDGIVYSMHSKQGLLILPGHYHKPLSFSPDLDILCLNFSLKKGKLHDSDFPCCSVFGLTDLTVALAAEHLDELNGCPPYSTQLVHSRIEQLTLRCFRTLGLLAPDTRRRTVNDEWRSVIIDGFFANRLSEQVTKEDLAAELHLSVRQLNRVLEKRFGMNFRDVLLRARMEHAAWLLRNTSLSIHEIAPQVGYTTSPSFIRSFARYYNISPLKFRNRKA